MTRDVETRQLHQMLIHQLSQQTQSPGRGTVSNSVNGTVFVTAPVNARPIVKVTPNVIGSSNNGLNPFLDRRLDEIRLPPPNDPFYQDDRFVVTSGSRPSGQGQSPSSSQQQQSHGPSAPHRHRRRVEVSRGRNGQGHGNGVGKRSFSKMQRDDRD